jgi:hypothetical protein
VRLLPDPLRRFLFGSLHKGAEVCPGAESIETLLGLGEGLPVRPRTSCAPSYAGPWVMHPGGHGDGRGA